MYDLSNKDQSCLFNLLESINKIKIYTNRFNHVDEFYNDSISFDATLMNFIIIGEMVDKLSQHLIESTIDKIQWYKVKSFRNIIAHNYFGIDAEEVWQIIVFEIPKLKKEIEQILNN